MTEQTLMIFIGGIGLLLTLAGLMITAVATAGGFVLRGYIRKSDAVSIQVGQLEKTMTEKFIEIRNDISAHLSDFRGRVNTVQSELKEHVSTCDEVPKKLIVERIENLCDRVDDHVKNTADSLREVKEELKSARTQGETMNLNFQALVTSLSDSQRRR